MFITGLGVGTVHLAAITEYPQLWRWMVFKCGIIFFDCATSIFSWSIFPDRKDRCTEGNRVSLFLFNDPMKAGHSAFLHGRYGYFSRYCACTTCIAGQVSPSRFAGEGQISAVYQSRHIRPSRPGPCQPTLRFRCCYWCMYVDGIRTIELHNSFTVIWSPCVAWLYGAIYAVLSSLPGIKTCAALLICLPESTTTPRLPHTYCSMGRYTFLLGDWRRHWWSQVSLCYC